MHVKSQYAVRDVFTQDFLGSHDIFKALSCRAASQLAAEDEYACE